MKTPIHLTLGLLAFTLAAPFAAEPAPPAELAKAVAEAGAGRLEEAASLLTQAAEKGSDQARWLLARLHAVGKIPGASLKNARMYLEAAAQSGHAAAAYDLARLAEAGALDGGKPDMDQAIFFYRVSAESGFAPAQHRMGEAAASGAGQPRDEKAALDWFRKGAEQKHPPSMLSLAGLLDRGAAADPKAATALIRTAAEAGFAPAMNALGVRLHRGEGAEKDAVAAAQWFQKAAAEGLAAAQVNLGHLSVKEPAAAAQQFAEAARAGHPVAQFLLADRYAHGRGVAVNPEKAFVLFSRAAEAPHEEAARRRDGLKSALSPAQAKEAARLLAEEAGPAAAAAPQPPRQRDYAAAPVPHAAFEAAFPQDPRLALAGALVVEGPALPPQYRQNASGGIGPVKAGGGKVIGQNW